MPSTFTRTPTETERKEPGIGGKPPCDPAADRRRWRRWGRRLEERAGRPARTASSHPLLSFFRPGRRHAVLCRAGAVLLRAPGRPAHGPPHPRVHGDWHPVRLPPILYLNTGLLLLSSLTMERARQNIFREIDVLEEWLGLGRPALRRTMPWVAATLVLGILFLAGQVIAWTQSDGAGFCLRSIGRRRQATSFTSSPACMPPT